MPNWFEPMFARREEACVDMKWDPATLGRSVGICVEPANDHTAAATGFGMPITGSSAEIADTIPGSERWV